MVTSESSLARSYRTFYEWICGSHPDLRPWHFQWLDGIYIYRQLRYLLPDLGGRILDVGCGKKPYRHLFGQVVEYIGLDVVSGSHVDVVVMPDEPWPFPDDYFDVVLSSQVLEHVEYLDKTLAEMKRVLKVGGAMVLTFPFLYNEHGTPWDFRRFTINYAVKLFEDLEVIYLERLGGIGSTQTILFLNWVGQSMDGSFSTRLLKGPLLPVWMLVSLVLNLFGVIVDRIDRTGAFYNSLILVVKKS